MAGIQETKEVLVAANELAVFLIGILKDGVSLSQDVKAIIEKLSNDEDFKEKMQAAFAGVSAVPSEVKELDGKEIVELVVLQAGYVPAIIDALKK